MTHFFFLLDRGNEQANAAVYNTKITVENSLFILRAHGKTVMEVAFFIGRWVVNPKDR